jgi:hypothetical protein
MIVLKTELGDIKNHEDKEAESLLLMLPWISKSRR